MFYICNEIITIYNKIRYKKNQIENKMRILELFKKNILSNFTSLKKVEVFIQGNASFEY